MTVNSLDNVNDFSGFNALRGQAAKPDAGTIHQVAQQFESVFINMMMKSMRDTVPEGGLFDDSAMKNYQSMMDSQLSVSLSKQGGFGLAKVIERQLGGGPKAAPSLASADVGTAIASHPVESPAEAAVRQQMATRGR